jgi:hypothetical protein
MDMTLVVALEIRVVLVTVTILVLVLEIIHPVLAMDVMHRNLADVILVMEKAVLVLASVIGNQVVPASAIAI